MTLHLPLNEFRMFNFYVHFCAILRYMNKILRNLLLGLGWKLLIVSGVEVDP